MTWLRIKSVRHCACRWWTSSLTVSKNKPCAYRSHFRSYACASAKALRETNVSQPQENTNNVNRNSKTFGTRSRYVKSLLNKVKGYEDPSQCSLLILKLLSALPDLHPEKRVQFSTTLIKTLRRLKANITEAHYVELLKCYIESRRSVNQKDFLMKMRSDGIEPSLDIKLLVLRCLAEEGRLSEMSDLANELKSSGNNYDEDIGSALVYGNTKAGNLDNALKELMLLKENNLTSKSQSYTWIIRAAILKNDKAALNDAISEAAANEIAFLGDEILSMLETAATSDCLHLLPSILEGTNTELVSHVLSNLLMKLIYGNSVKYAYEVLLNLLSLENLKSVTATVKRELSECYIEELINLNHPFDDLLTKSLEIRNLFGFYATEHVLYNCLQKKDLSTSLSTINFMFLNDVPVLAHYFRPIMVQFKDRYGLNGVTTVMSIMNQMEVFPEEEALSNYFFPYMKKNIKSLEDFPMSPAALRYLKEIFIVYTLKNNLCWLGLMALESTSSELEDYSFMNEACFTALTSYPPCAETVKLVRELKAFDPISAIIDLWDRQQIQWLRELLKLLLDHGLYSEDEEKIIYFLNKPNLPEDIKTDIQALKSPNSRERNVRMKPTGYEILTGIVEDEIVLKEMEKKSMNVNSLLFRLLRSYIKAGMYKKASRTKEKIKQVTKNQLELSPALMSILCRLSLYEGNEDEAMDYYQQMTENYPGFRLDFPKACPLIKMFVQKGLTEEIEHIFKNLSPWRGSAKTAEKRVNEILVDAAKLGDLKILNLLCQQLVQNRLVYNSWAPIRAYVLSYINSNNFDGAVTVFKKFLETEGPTLNSGFQELITTALRLNRIDAMEDLVNAVNGYDPNNFYSLIACVVVASLMDDDYLKSFIQAHDISLKDKRFYSVLSPEFFKVEPKERMQAFKGMIKQTKRSPERDFFISLAIIHLRNLKEPEITKDFHSFLTGGGIRKKELENLIELFTIVKPFIRERHSSKFVSSQDLNL